MQFFFSFNRIEESNDFIRFLSNDFPTYLTQPTRLSDILALFQHSGQITAIVEPEYIDRQYRDSYYSYFSQKYSEYKQNCLRLAFFEGVVTSDDFIKNPKGLEQLFIGTIVLRPLNVGMIGQTLIDPKKLNLSCYLQTCNFCVTICGRKLHISAFPFSSQDAETMTCAETSLYNLIRYYGEKYSEYHVLMPNEILSYIENAYYERVLPAKGIHEEYIAKVLSDAHFYPRLYTDITDLEDILHIYIESGIPLILGLPGHVVNCIGHGPIDYDFQNHDIIELVTIQKIEGKAYYYLSTSALIDEYVVMDDNKTPYYVTPLDSLTAEYYCADNSPEDDSSEEEDFSEEEVFSEDGNFTENQILTSAISGDFWRSHNSIIVPLYRRIFIDAARAKQIFNHLFLKDTFFISSICETYGEPDWGCKADNPFVWRIYLTSSNKYRDFKIQKAQNDDIASYYMANTFPRFVWVLEIGTLTTFKQHQARIEILLDATSSIYSQNWGILSIAYKDHFVFTPSISPDVGITPDDTHDPEMPANQAYLTAIFNSLYNEPVKLFGETFETFGNLEGINNGHA